MASLLIITPVEKLQEKANYIVKSFKDMSGIYISLNKTQKSVEDIFKKTGDLGLTAESMSIRSP